jgi:hypothetical protein
VTKDIHAKENEIAQVANELARIKVDSLNTTAHNTQLKATHLEVEEELHRKEALIAKYDHHCPTCLFCIGSLSIVVQVRARNPPPH